MGENTEMSSGQWKSLGHFCSLQHGGCDNMEKKSRGKSGLKPEMLFKQSELLPLKQSLVTLDHNSNLVVITH